jgi:type VI protein secretion system component Hcp
MDLYLKFEGIDGPLTAPKGCFKGLGLQMNIKRGVRSTEGGGFSYKDKGEFGEVTITKYADTASQIFPEKMLEAIVIPSVEIIMKANQVERIITLGDTRITNINSSLDWEDKYINLDSDGRLVLESRDEIIKESITLHYEKIEWNMNMKDKSHGYVFDIIAQQKIDKISSADGQA